MLKINQIKTSCKYNKFNTITKEQKEAIEGINKNISTISHISEDNVEKNSEAVSISENLKQLSDKLDAMIVQFKI